MIQLEEKFKLATADNQFCFNYLDQSVSDNQFCFGLVMFNAFIINFGWKFKRQLKFHLLVYSHYHAI